MSATWKANNPDITFFGVESGSSPSLDLHNIRGFVASPDTGKNAAMQTFHRYEVIVRNVMDILEFGV